MSENSWIEDKPASSDWHPWPGFEWSEEHENHTPVPRNTHVELKLRGGDTLDQEAGGFGWYTGYEGDPSPSPADIVEYRIVKLVTDGKKIPNITGSQPVPCDCMVEVHFSQGKAVGRAREFWWGLGQEDSIMSYVLLEPM